VLTKIVIFLALIIVGVLVGLAVISSNYVSYSIDSANKCQWNNGQRTGLTTLAFGFTIEKRLLTKEAESDFLKESEKKNRCVNKQLFYKTLIFVTRNKVGIVGESERIKNNGWGF
jgi:glucan phosphoethanolaminetransferase (alkaline phosphatase superfamily)